MTLRSGSLATGASFNTIASQGMKLSQIIPSGYKGVSYWEDGKRGGFKNQITLTILDGYGNISSNKFNKARCFKWTHSWDKTDKWAENGYWYRLGDTSDIISSSNDETFELGEGLWVEVSGGAYTSAKVGQDQYIIKFPGMDDTYADEAE